MNIIAAIDAKDLPDFSQRVKYYHKMSPFDKVRS